MFALRIIELIPLVTPTEIIRLLMSMQVDRVDRQRIYWNGNYVNPNSLEYRLLEDEATQAVSDSTIL